MLTYQIKYDIILVGGKMKYISRAMEEKLVSMIDKYQVIMITGPRQVGKSTLLSYISRK